jgi:hypothetical protein
MEDEEIALLNGCTDLVSLRKCEAFSLRLLQGKRPGELVRIRELCLQAGVAAGELKPELFAAWLADPTAVEAYAVILFYDDESKWSMAAQYNRRRLIGDEPTRPTRAASPAASGSASPQAAPIARP